MSFSITKLPAGFELVVGTTVRTHGDSVFFDRKVAEQDKRGEVVCGPVGSLYRYVEESMIRIAYGAFDAQISAGAFQILEGRKLYVGCLTDFGEAAAEGPCGVLVDEDTTSASLYVAGDRIIAFVVGRGMVKIYQIDSANRRKILLMSFACPDVRKVVDNAAVSWGNNRSALVQFGEYCIVCKYVMLDVVPPP